MRSLCDWSPEVCSSDLADSPSRINRPLPQAVLTRPYLQFIDFRRQHEIAFAEPVDLVRPDRHVDFAAAKADVRMVRSEERRVGKECSAKCRASEEVWTG